jgi:hypothetical protein
MDLGKAEWEMFHEWRIRERQNFVMDVQVVELGQKLNVVGGNIWTVICVACVWEEGIQIENKHKVSENSLFWVFK